MVKNYNKYKDNIDDDLDKLGKDINDDLDGDDLDKDDLDKYKNIYDKINNEDIDIDINNEETIKEYVNNLERDEKKNYDYKETYGYTKVDDPHLQLKLYKKREYYYYKLHERPELSNYKEIEEYRKKSVKRLLLARSGYPHRHLYLGIWVSPITCRSHFILWF